MAESIQHWLDRNRPPRVHITYDVETGGAMERKELPFVVGIMADLCGVPYTDDARAAPGAKTDTLEEKPEGIKARDIALGRKHKPMAQRKFVAIDRDNFEEVMAKVLPVASYTPKLTPEGEAAAAKLTEAKLGPLAEHLANFGKNGQTLAFEVMEDFEPHKVVMQLQGARDLHLRRKRLAELRAKVDGNAKLYEMLDAALADDAKRKALREEAAKIVAELAPPPAAGGGGEKKAAKAEEKPAE